MTTRSHLYVMQAGHGPVKIGSSRAPQRRLSEVHCFHRDGFEGEITLRYSVPVPADLKPRSVEHLAHLLAANDRLKGEWFDLSPDEAVEVIQRAIVLRGEYPKMVPYEVRMSSDMKEGIKRYRFSKQINSETEAIRRLLEKALDAEGIE